MLVVHRLGMPSLPFALLRVPSLNAVLVTAFPSQPPGGGVHIQPTPPKP
jgi:hypothetical protein